MFIGIGLSLDVMITSINPLIEAAEELERAANSIKFAADVRAARERAARERANR